MIADTAFDKLFSSLETWPEDLIVAIPDDAHVSVTVSGEFIRSLRITMEHMFSSLNERETIVFFAKAEKAFVGVPQNEITEKDKALWTIYVLMLTIAENARLQDVTKAFTKATYTGSPDDKPLSDEELEKRTKPSQSIED
jgi:hypothetical protein